MLAHRVEGSEHEHLPIAWAHPSKKQLHVEQSLYGARGMIEVVAMNRFLGGVKKEEGRGYIGVIVALQHALSRGNVVRLAGALLILLRVGGVANDV